MIRTRTQGRRTTNKWTRSRLWLSRLEDRTAPAVFTVNDPGDNGNGTLNTGDLRDRLSVANSNGEDDTINFSFAGATTITLAGSELSISEAQQLAIIGPTGSASVTVDANKLSRVLHITVASQVAISNLTLTGGLVTDNGGAIAVTTASGDLSLDHCTISNSKASGTNSGGGIYMAADGKLSIVDSTVSGNTSTYRGGGIYFFDSGSLIMDRSTASNNRASGSYFGGGGVYFYGTPGAAGFTITNSTISGNSTGGIGGGLTIRNGNGNFVIRNSTIANNTSSGVFGGGFADYTGLTTPGANVTIQSTIVSGNVNANAPDIGYYTYYGSLDTITVNTSLIGVADTFVFSGSNNLTGTKANPLNAKLGPLSNNGGPTLTMMPLSGSPVREKGSADAGVTVDQRGQTRLQGAAVDIGSVESVDPSPAATATTIPPIAIAGTTPNTVQVTYNDNESLINVSTIDVNDIEIIAPNGTTKLAITGVTVDNPTNGKPRVATYTFTPPGGSWDVADDGLYTVNIVGNQVFDTDSPTPSAVSKATLGTFRVVFPQTFVVDVANDVNDGNFSKGNLSLREALQLANANPGSRDTITFDPTVFATQKTITLTGGQLTVGDAVTITGPAAKLVLDANQLSRVMLIDAPGIGNLVSISNMVFTKGLMTGRTLDTFGGGIAITDESVTLTNCEVSNNTSEGTGGGIYIRGNTFPTDPGSLTILDSVIKNNASNGIPNSPTDYRIGSGGGLSIDQAGKLVIRRTTVSDNTSQAQGGGVYFVASGTLDMSETTISGNTADGNNGGGGLYFYGTVVGGMKIVNSTISSNTASIGPGGGIELNTFNNSSQLQVFNSTITNNFSASGGGISRNGGGSTIPLTLSSTIVAGNLGVSGVDIFLAGGTPTSVSGNNNLIGVADDTNATFTGTGNLTGIVGTPEDPMLGPLDFYGGPTKTHKLLSGSPAINAGNNIVPVSTDQRGAPRVFGASADIGAYEVAPAQVTSVVINNGAVQRSRVTTLKVNFNQPVAFNDISKAFTLNRVGDGNSVTLNTVLDPSGTFVTITFTGGAVDANSLADGRYTLTALAAQFNVTDGFDGNNDGTVGDNYQLLSTPYQAGPPAVAPTGIFRRFGDSDGNGIVDSADFLAFRLAFLSPSSIFDINNDNVVDAADFLQFRLRFLTTVT